MDTRKKLLEQFFCDFSWEGESGKYWRRGDKGREGGEGRGDADVGDSSLVE